VRRQLLHSRIQLALACFVATHTFGAPASASELVIGRDAVQSLVLATIFKDQGKWYFAKGTCYAYLERPRIALAGGRLIIYGHLSSRVGLEVGTSCVGTDFASDVQISGRFVGAGSQITLDDIRIDSVKDESTRQALDLLQTAAGTSLPRAVKIDLLQLLEPATVPGTAIKVTVTGLDIGQVTTQPDRVKVDFEMKLSAR
jgi:hypothetical protein